MNETILQYISKNGLRFHHTITSSPSTENEIVSESHPMCEIFLLLSGSVNYSIEGKLYKISPNDLLIIAPNELHSVKVSPDEPYNRMVLHFSPDLLPVLHNFDVLTSITKTSSFAHVIPGEYILNSDIIPLMTECETICRTKNKYVDLRLIGTIFRITESLDNLITEIQNSDSKNWRQPIHIDTISHSCIQYINKNISNTFTIQNIADTLHISISHLKHAFKKEIGITLHQYIVNQKMQLAKMLLMKGESPQAVSKTLGYEYYCTFYQNFIKRFGCTPSSYDLISHQVWTETHSSGSK